MYLRLKPVLIAVEHLYKGKRSTLYAYSYSVIIMWVVL